MAVAVERALSNARSLWDNNLRWIAGFWHPTICSWYFLILKGQGIQAGNSRGRARGPAGFDAPFNMGSAKGEIEWNSIFQGKYLTDNIK